MSRVRRDDRGIAALELAIFASVLMLLAFGALPLYSMLRGYQRVAKASAATLRYATGVSANGHLNSAGTLARRPSYDEIASFARDAANDTSLGVDVEVCKSGTCTAVATSGPSASAPIPAKAGDTVRVTLRTTVDLSVLGRVANAATSLTGGSPAFPENAFTIASTADAREE